MKVLATLAFVSSIFLFLGVGFGVLSFVIWIRVSDWFSPTGSTLIGVVSLVAFMPVLLLARNLYLKAGELWYSE
jgi:hypothetical protein